MATIKKAKAKNLSAGPSKKTPIAPKVDPKGQYTKVQERTLGSMKKGGKIKKAQDGVVSDSIQNLRKKYAEEAQQKRVKNAADAKAKTKQYADEAEAKRKMYTSKPTQQKTGGKTSKNWIQDAVNPEHKGFCTPLSKKTCTPKRKALAQTFKRMAAKRKGK